MLPINKKCQVTKFWNSEDAKNYNDETVVEIVHISALAEDSYLNETWSEAEYKEFSMKIKSMSMADFHVIYPLLVVLFNLTEKELTKELKRMIERGFYVKEQESTFSTPGCIANCVVEIKSKINQFANLPLTDEEERTNNRTEVIEKEKALLEELKDKNSDYNKILGETYRAWVNTYFTDSYFYEALLKREKYVIDQKRRNLELSINKHKFTVERRKITDTLGSVFEYSAKRSKENIGNNYKIYHK